MPARAHFTPALFRFLQELKANNDREWFQDNKHRYEDDVKAPLLDFIADFQKPLAKISPHFRADPRANGGSMFRIYRDTRFSKDKTPYKTAASAQFRHEHGKDAHCPGFYLHLEPGSVFLGAGIWRPDSKSAGKIREAILEDPDRWKRILRAKALREDFEFHGDSLKRPPRGVDADHPLLDELKRKDFIAVTSMTQKEATSPGFLDAVAKRCRQAGKYVEFLTEALGHDY